MLFRSAAGIQVDNASRLSRLLFTAKRSLTQIWSRPAPGTGTQRTTENANRTRQFTSRSETHPCPRGPTGAAPWTRLPGSVPCGYTAEFTFWQFKWISFRPRSPPRACPRLQHVGRLAAVVGSSRYSPFRFRRGVGTVAAGKYLFTSESDRKSTRLNSSH